MSRHDQLHRVAERPEARTGRGRPLSSVLVVLVVSPDPDLEGTVLVAPLRRAVENWVVAHQELDPAGVRRVGVVHDALSQGESAHAKTFREVAGIVRPGCGRVLAEDRRGLALEDRYYLLAHLLVRVRDAEVEVEVALGRRHP